MYKYEGKILTENELIKEIRKTGVDKDNELSDEYILNESYQLGEWEIAKFARKCDCCGKGMNKGYYDSGEYYCSDRCLVWGNSEENITLNQVGLYDMNDWARDHEENPDECYWTEWEEIDPEDYYDAQGNNYQEGVLI